VAQTAQRILHGAKDANTGQVHDFALIKQLLREELADIISRRNEAAPSDEASQAELKAQVARYESAYKIAMRWTKNYTELNFRSLGSYTPADMERIASDPDAF
jgi:hypothetical protein